MPQTEEWLVGIGIAYLFVGIEKLFLDFAGTPLDRPAYTFKPNAPMLTLIWLTWPFPALSNRELVYFLSMWVSASVLFSLTVHWGTPYVDNIWLIAGVLFVVRFVPIVRYVVLLPVTILTEIVFLIVGKLFGAKHPGQSKLS